MEALPVETMLHFCEVAVRKELSSCLRKVEAELSLKKEEVVKLRSEIDHLRVMSISAGVNVPSVAVANGQRKSSGSPQTVNDDTLYNFMFYLVHDNVLSESLSFSFHTIQTEATAKREVKWHLRRMFRAARHIFSPLFSQGQRIEQKLMALKAWKIFLEIFD
ncbi:unnamed protein product [Toxocara canis]|uniref:Uncharacterized protein n=1 Tax=Toxocara canis TaxID=6265 RepID=A0A3P7FHJ4_TOXCA|nr:unnamed protein product [Toxocara canis]